MIEVPLYLLPKINNLEKHPLPVDCILKNGNKMHNIILKARSEKKDSSKTYISDFEQNNIEFEDIFDNDHHYPEMDSYNYGQNTVGLLNIAKVIASKNLVPDFFYKSIKLKPQDIIFDYDEDYMYTTEFPSYYFVIKMKNGEYFNCKLKTIDEPYNFFNIPENYIYEDIDNIYDKKVFFDNRLLDYDYFFDYYSEPSTYEERQKIFNSIKFIGESDYFVCYVNLEKHLNLFNPI